MSTDNTFDSWTPPGLGRRSGPEPTGRAIETSWSPRQPDPDSDEGLLAALREQVEHPGETGGTNRLPPPWRQQPIQPAAGITRVSRHIPSRIRSIR